MSWRITDPPAADAPVLLTLRNEDTLEYYDVLRKKTHLVGRAGFNGDLEIKDDTSVSRRHAVISLIKKTVGGMTRVCLKLVDNESKFGTFVNNGIESNEQIANNCPVFLGLGDRIRFGRINSYWTVEKYPIVACPSTLKMADKEMLKRSLAKLGGQVTRDWSEQCTHLCMNTITITEKVLMCLASAKSIVLPKYFIDLCEALSPDSLKELPFCIEYKPNLTENLLNPNSVSLTVNNKRKTLFFRKTFICSSLEQSNRISKIIKAAGGKTIVYINGILPNKDILNVKEYICMQQDPFKTEDKNEDYQLIIEKLEALNRRPIPENEIGLAVIFATTLTYCNPNYNTSLVNLESQQSNVSESQISPKVLAPETEMINVVGESEVFSVNVVPDSNYDTQSNLKRPFKVVMDSSEFESPSKKQKLILNNPNIYNDSIELRTDETVEPLNMANKLVLSNSDHTSKLSVPIKPVKNASSNINDSFVTTYTLPSLKNDNFAWLQADNVTKNNVSNITKNNQLETVENEAVTEQNLSSVQNSNKNNYSAWLQTNDVTKNKNVHNFQTEMVENKTIAKKKISNINSMNIDEDDDDLFNYRDVDEIEEQPKKKSKIVNMESILFPMLTTSDNKTEQQEYIEPKVNKAVDPSFIINLLSEAKGTGEFIDGSKPCKISNVIEDAEYDDLINSVVVETVSMVVSKPSEVKTQSLVQSSFSTLQNFKKFKRKEPMRIPHIVPMKLV